MIENMIGYDWKVDVEERERNKDRDCFRLGDKKEIWL